MTYLTSHRSFVSEVGQNPALLELSIDLTVTPSFISLQFPDLIWYTPSRFCNKWILGSEDNSFPYFLFLGNPRLISEQSPVCSPQEADRHLQENIVILVIKDCDITIGAQYSQNKIVHVSLSLGFSTLGMLHLMTLGMFF